MEEGRVVGLILAIVIGLVILTACGVLSLTFLILMLGAL